MRYLNVASVAAFALFGILAVPVVHAQIHGTPTSVTSMGFGGRFDRAPGTRSSVTSLGPQGYTGGNQAFNPQNCCMNPLFPVNPNPPQRGEHRPGRRPGHHPRPVNGGVYAVPYPVYVTEPYMEDAAPEQSQQPLEYSAGPTIFDRRASGQSSAAAEAEYGNRMRDTRPVEEPSQPAPAATAEAAPEPEQPRTVLIFKDGHQVEVQNYAIIGNLLYDMTPGRRSKIAVADLDLPSTIKQNDERGVNFQLPVRPIVN